VSNKSELHKNVEKMNNETASEITKISEHKLLLMVLYRATEDLKHLAINVDRNNDKAFSEYTLKEVNNLLEWLDTTYQVGDGPFTLSYIAEHLSDDPVGFLKDLQSAHGENISKVATYMINRKPKKRYPPARQIN
jgi:hypothetical protein